MGEAPACQLRLRPSLAISALPEHVSYRTRFKLAVQAGFEGIELGAATEPGEMKRIADAAAEERLVIHSVAPRGQERDYLSDANPSAAIKQTLQALNAAKQWQAETVFVRPAKVDDANSYADAYRRSQEVIAKEIVPVARDLGIVVLIENIREVGFMQSPFEFARYADELHSPWVKALLDVGNMPFGNPEHWVPIMGSRIAKLHVKDFRFYEGPSGFHLALYRRLGNGSMAWSALRQALAGIGYSG